MARSLTAILLAVALTGAAPALAIDGHGNAGFPERAVPNTGGVSGGPTHRDDPRVREAGEVRPDGKPAHFTGDGHAHGHGRSGK